MFSAWDVGGYAPSDASQEKSRIGWGFFKRSLSHDVRLCVPILEMGCRILPYFASTPSSVDTISFFSDTCFLLGIRMLIFIFCDTFMMICDDCIILSHEV